MVSKEFFGETKNVEFKREIPSKHEKFLKDIIAFHKRYDFSKTTRFWSSLHGWQESISHTCI